MDFKREKTSRMSFAFKDEMDLDFLPTSQSAIVPGKLERHATMMVKTPKQSKDKLPQMDSKPKVSYQEAKKTERNKRKHSELLQNILEAIDLMIEEHENSYE
jgi:hypothetical protein